MLNESEQCPPTIDAAAAARWARHVPQDGSPWLHEEIGRRMEQRLQWITRRPRHWLDWSPLRGGLEAHAQVARRYPRAQAFVVEPEPVLWAPTQRALSSSWWSARRWKKSAVPAARFGVEALPEGGVDLLWSNMALHMAANPQALIAQWHRYVAVDGFLMFSCLGPDTVRELRALYARQGWPAAGHELTDMHDWGDMLAAAGFAEPVMDMERIELTWSTPAAALAELRMLGRNLHPARFGALRGRHWHAALGRALAALAEGHAQGRIGMTFEIIYGHAFKSAPRVKVAAQSALSLGDMREMLQHGRRPD